MSKKQAFPYRLLGWIMELGCMMVLCIFLGLGIGWVLYTVTDKQIWVVVFIIVGVAAGFLSVYKLLAKELDNDRM